MLRYERRGQKVSDLKPAYLFHHGTVKIKDLKLDNKIGDCNHRIQKAHLVLIVLYSHTSVCERQNAREKCLCFLYIWMNVHLHSIWLPATSKTIRHSASKSSWRIYFQTLDIKTSEFLKYRELRNCFQTVWRCASPRITTMSNVHMRVFLSIVNFSTACNSLRELCGHAIHYSGFVPV